MGVLDEVLEHRLRFTREPDGTVVYHLDRATRTWPVERWQLLAVAIGVRMTGFLRGRRFANEVSPLLSELMHSVRASHRLEVDALGRKIHVVDTGRKRYDRDEAKQEHLVALMDGLLLEQPVTLSYLSHRSKTEGQEPRALTVNPLCMVLHRGAMYFVVLVPTVGEGSILLALDRIQEARVEMDAPPFLVPRDFDPQRYFESAFGIWTGGESQRVILRIDADYAPYVAERSWHSSQEMRWDDQGRLILELQLGELREIEEWILGMGEKVEVLEPSALRGRVRDRHRMAAERATAPEGRAT